jgi:hypothetical protein
VTGPPGRVLLALPTGSLRPFHLDGYEEGGSAMLRTVITVLVIVILVIVLLRLV